MLEMGRHQVAQTSVDYREQQIRLFQNMMVMADSSGGTNKGQTTTYAIDDRDQVHNDITICYYSILKAESICSYPSLVCKRGQPVKLPTKLAIQIFHTLWSIGQT